MIVCAICHTEVEKHRPNQVICGKKLCKSRYVELGRKNQRWKAGEKPVKWQFDVGFLNRWMERCYGR